MRAVDTNVLVRLLARDDPEQASVADDAIAKGAWVSQLVLAEALWVLDAVYERTPKQLAAALDLLLAHETLDETRESLRLLETMSGQFPTDKAVLRKAGSVFLEQGAFGKGLEYLERARQLDPLDPEVLGGIVRGHTELMEEQYKTNARDKHRRN